MVVRQRRAQLDIVRVFTGDEEIGFADGEGLRIEFLSVQMEARVGGNVFVHPFLADGEHAAGAAARIEDGTDDAFAAQVVFIARKHQGNEEPHHIAGCIVFPARFVRHFRELTQQLFEHRTHGMVVNPVRMQIYFGELINQRIQFLVLEQFFNRFIQLKILDDLMHILREPVEVVREVHFQSVRVRLQPLQVVSRGIVEGQTGFLFDDRIDIVYFIFERFIQFNNFILMRFDEAIEAPQHHEGQDHIAVFMGFEQSPQFIVAHFPYKRGYFLKPVGHGSKIGDWGEGRLANTRQFNGKIMPPTRKIKTQGRFYKTMATLASRENLAAYTTDF